MTRFPDNEACNVDRLGISATSVSRSEMYSGVRTSKHNFTGFSRRLVTSATLGEPESHGHMA